MIWHKWGSQSRRFFSTWWDMGNISDFFLLIFKTKKIRANKHKLKLHTFFIEKYYSPPKIINYQKHIFSFLEIFWLSRYLKPKIFIRAIFEKPLNSCFWQTTFIIENGKIFWLVSVLIEKSLYIRSKYWPVWPSLLREITAIFIKKAWKSGSFVTNDQMKFCNKRHFSWNPSIPLKRVRLWHILTSWHGQ